MRFDIPAIRSWSLKNKAARDEYHRAPFCSKADNTAARVADECVGRGCTAARIDGAERCASHEAGRQRYKGES